MDAIGRSSHIQAVKGTPAAANDTSLSKEVSSYIKGDSVNISAVTLTQHSIRQDESKHGIDKTLTNEEPAGKQPEDTVETKIDIKSSFSTTISDTSVDPARERKQIEQVCNIKPNISCPRNARVIEKALSILKGNCTHINGHTFTTPSKIVESDSRMDYEGKQWLWDSCFHAMILADTEPETAKEELRSAVANQHKDGFIPHMNYFRGDAQKVPKWAKPHFEAFLKTRDGMRVPEGERDTFVNTYWSYPDHSDITQPPVIGAAVEEVFRQIGDKAFVKEMLPKLKGYYNYLHDKRDPDRDNLISIIHPWESGWDNSQRWDETVGVKDGERSNIDQKKMRIFSEYKMMGWDLDEIFKSDQFNVEPVDFNVLYAKNMESVSRLCEAVGDKEGAKLYGSRADATRKAIFEKMWDGDKYVDFTGNDEKKSEVKSAAMFYPMMLDGEQHGTQMVERHLMNPDEFNVSYGVPTTSADHEKYDPAQYWRGNVWQNVNVFVFQSLEKQMERTPGHMPTKIMAEKIKDSSFELLDKFGFSEYFNPEKGDGHGVQTFGWNGMVKFMEDTYKQE